MLFFYAPAPLMSVSGGVVFSDSLAYSYTYLRNTLMDNL